MLFSAALKRVSPSLEREPVSSFWCNEAQSQKTCGKPMLGSWYAHVRQLVCSGMVAVAAWEHWMMELPELPSSREHKAGMECCERAQPAEPTATDREPHDPGLPLLPKYSAVERRPVRVGLVGGLRHHSSIDTLLPHAAQVQKDRRNPLQMEAGGIGMRRRAPAIAHAMQETAQAVHGLVAKTVSLLQAAPFLALLPPADGIGRRVERIIWALLTPRQDRVRAARECDEPVCAKQSDGPTLNQIFKSAAC